MNARGRRGLILDDDRILITGGTGLIGTNLANALKKKSHEVLAIGSQFDLRNPIVTQKIFREFKPTIVYHLAAKVGGIYANSNYKSDFYSDNVLINTNVINECSSTNVRYVFAMGTGCAYPKRLESEILREDDFLDGIAEVTNDAYAYAKRGLLVHLRALSESNRLKYLYCIPANIYGPFDNYHPMHSHVVPGLIRRFCDAIDDGHLDVTIWGDGRSKRDFLYIDDCVEAIYLLTNLEAQGSFNVCTTRLTSVSNLAHEIKKASGYEGQINFDIGKPSGQTQRIFDSTRMDQLGWKPKVSLAEGIQRTVDWFRVNRSNIRER